MGQMSARLDTNDERHAENQERLEAIEVTLKELVDAIALARGGIRMLFAVGTVAAALGAFFHTAVSWFVGHWK